MYRIETGSGLEVANVVEQLQHLPPLTGQDPLAWLRSESWNPQWTPHCSWGPTGQLRETLPFLQLVSHTHLPTHIDL